MLAISSNSYNIMATDEDLPQIEIQYLAADKEQTCGEKDEEFHADINYTSYSEELHNTPPQFKPGKLTNPIHIYAKVRSKFKNCHCCLWSSKAVVLILFWNLIISIGFKSFFDPSLYTVTILNYNFNDNGGFHYDYNSALITYGLSYGINALYTVSLLSPSWIPG